MGYIYTVSTTELTADFCSHEVLVSVPYITFLNTVPNRVFVDLLTNLRSCLYLYLYTMSVSICAFSTVGSNVQQNIANA